jgi:hypothetical protein
LAAPERKNEGSGFGVFKLDPKDKLYGTLPELSAIGQITLLVSSRLRAMLFILCKARLAARTD